MKVDAMDAIVCDRQQKRREWRPSFVEDQRGLAIELVDFGFEVRAAGCRRHERGNPPCAMQRLLKIANSAGAPAFRTSIRDHYGILRQHGSERVNVTCGRGLRECCEQALVGFRGSGKQSFVLRDVLSRALKELSTRGLILADERGNIFVIEVENVPEQQHRAFGGVRRCSTTRNAIEI